jgi:hypothetical protein
MYIESHLDRFCELSAVVKADAAGLGPLFMGKKPTKVWAIERIAVYPPMLNRAVSPTTWRACGSFIVQMPDMSFGFIGESGGFRRIHKPILGADGVPRKAAVFALHGMAQPPAGARSVVNMRAVDDGSLALKDVMARAARTELSTVIAQWKEENYDASVLEKILRLLVPFYEVAHLCRNDPGYELKAQDIALDVLSVTLALGTIGIASVGGAAGMRVALAAARGAAAQGTRAMISTAIRSGAAQFTSRALLRAAGRELTDLVVPVFSVHDLLRLTVGRRAKAAAQGLASLAHPTRVAMGFGRPPGVLDELYETLVLTRAVGPHISAVDLKKAIDMGASAAIPPTVFRGQSFLGSRNVLYLPEIGVGGSVDDYLVACLKHASRTSGAVGAPMSLSAHKAVARRFSAGREAGVIISIDTTRDAGNFRTIESIIKHDGPRLVEQNKLTRGTLMAAIKNAFIQEEKEILYLGGAIPDEFILRID